MAPRNLLWFVRAKRWAQRPPPEWRVKLVFGVVAAALVLFGIEYVWGWPDWLSVTMPERVRP